MLMSICETDIVPMTKTTFERVNNALLVNYVGFFSTGLQDITSLYAGENRLQ